MRFKYYLRGAGIGVIVATLILSVAFLFHDNISDEEVIRRAMKLGMVMQENNTGTLAEPSSPDASLAGKEDSEGAPGGAEADNDPLAGAQGNETGGPTGSQDGTGADGGTDTQEPPEGGTPAGETQDPNASQGSGTSQDPDENSDSDKGNADKDNSDKDNSDKDSTGKQDAKDSSVKPDQKGDKDDAKGDKASGSESGSSKGQASGSGQDEPDEVEIVIESGDVSRMVSAKVFEAGLVDSADEFNSYLGSNDYDNMLQPGTYKIKKGSSFRQIAQILTRQ